jgi:hypothetical protein
LTDAVYQLVSIVGEAVTPLTTSDELTPLAHSRDLLNAQAAPGVRYAVRLVLIGTRPLAVLEDDPALPGPKETRPA